MFMDFQYCGLRCDRRCSDLLIRFDSALFWTGGNLLDKTFSNLFAQHRNLLDSSFG